MARLRNIQEVLWISAPKLVFFSIVVDSLSTGGHYSPSALELLLDGPWQLY